MPRKNKLAVDVAVAILMEFSDHFCNNNKLADYSDPIWQQMSKKCQNAWSAHNWWVNVKYNRREIFSLARQKMGLEMPDLQSSLKAIKMNQFILIILNSILHFEKMIRGLT